ncbi:hypothetical protein B0I37DRAFT_299071, partial [Chaetomium sp. MPI-CAGE-AT-0009]
FFFADTDIAKEDNLSAQDLQRQTSQASKCGSLLVTVYNMEESGWTDLLRDYSNPPTIGFKEVSEKALEGSTVDCAATFTFERVPEPPACHRRQWNYSDPKRRPCAVFEFLYRSK